MKIHLSILALFLTTQSWGSHCLESATNEELLSEISFRLGTNPSRQLEILVDYTCNVGKLKINTVNLNTAQESSLVFDLNYQHDCVEVSNLLKKKIGNKIQKTSLVAFCNRTNLNRLVFNELTGIKQMEPVKFSYAHECAEKAKEINSIN